MMLKTIYLLCLLTATESFVVLPSHNARVAILKSTANDEVLARLEKEYKQLQEELLQDLVLKKDKILAEDVAEVMLEKAAMVAAVQKDKQQEIMDEAHKDLLKANDDILRAQALKHEAHNDAMSAEHEASLLGSIRAVYEDIERLRDNAVMHAAHHLEEDARDLELESTFRQHQAENKEEVAAATIKQLDENLVQLKDSLKNLRQLRNEKAMEEWKQEKKVTEPPPKAHVNLNSGTGYDEVLDRLEKEYKYLQEELLQDLVLKKDTVAAEEVAEAMIEKLATAAAVLKDRQQEIIDEAHKDLLNANDDILRAQALKQEAHNDAMSAEHEASLLGSIEAAYEDIERLRDNAVVHAAHHLEEDARDLELDSTFRVLQAENKEEEAVKTIKQLEEDLVQLKDSLKKLREEKIKTAMEGWKQEKKK